MLFNYSKCDHESLNEAIHTQPLGNGTQPWSGSLPWEFTATLEAFINCLLCASKAQPAASASIFFSHQDWLSPTFPHSPSLCRVPIQDPGRLGFSSLPLPSLELTSSSGACTNPGIPTTKAGASAAWAWLWVALPSSWGNSYPGITLWSLLGSFRD